VKSYLKEPRLENPNLLLLARNQLRPCLLQVPGICTHRPGAYVQCCACHGNSSIYGKGSRIKAHDFFSVWGCARGHTWLDESYTASGAERQQAFRYALVRQIAEWSKLLEDPLTGPKDRASCLWALEHLAQRGYSMCNTAGVFVPNLVLPWSHDARIQKTA
jgi:hypothetical protein